MDPIIRSSEQRRGVEVSAPHGVEDAEQRLRLLIHEMSNLIDGSMRSLNHVRSQIDEPDTEGGAEVRMPDVSLAQLGRVAATLEQMADLLRSATGSPTVPRIRSAARTTQELLEQVVGFTGPIAEDRGIRIVMSVSSEASGVSAPPIESVLLNVMRNSVDAIGRGGRIDVIASVEGTSEGDEVLQLTVLDDGCGPPDEPERLFEAGVTTRVEGTGLGLSLSRRIVEELGGRITLSSRWPEASLGSDASRRGARVEIRLPL